jgi:DNA invertase Pin-like site-specific DNA recombinase
VIAIYERVSTTGQNLAGQHKELETWAKGQTDPVTWYSDKASGKAMKRPGFDRLWASVERGEINRIVVWRLDRLGRTCRGLVNLFDDLQERKVTLVSLKDGLDLGTTTGRLIARIMASVAAYEVEVLTEKQRAGIQAVKEAIVKGERRWFKNGSPKRPKRKLTPEKEAEIREMVKAGKPVAKVARIVGLSRKHVYHVLKSGTAGQEG